MPTINNHFLLIATCKREKEKGEKEKGERHTFYLAVRTSYLAPYCVHSVIQINVDSMNLLWFAALLKQATLNEQEFDDT